MKTVGELRDGVAGILSGTNLDKVTGLYKCFERAARKLVQKADIPEASQKLGITLYDGVYDYEAPEKIFGSALVDIRPQGVSRWFGEDVQKVPVELFDRTKGTLPGGYKVAFEYKDGVAIARIDATRPFPRAEVDKMSEVQDWVESGSIINFTRDTVSYYETPASLRFTLVGDSVGTLTKTIKKLNIPDFENVAVGFLALRLPETATATDLESIELRLGSDAANYDSVTVTEGFLGAWTVGEFILVAFDMSMSTSTGTPDWENITYVQLSFTHGTMLTNVRVGGLWLALPSPHEILFQTAAIFVCNNARCATITQDEDSIVLNDAAYNIYEQEAALAVALQQNQDNKAAQIRNVLFGGEGDAGLYAQYNGDNPSNELRTVGTYYQM
jgi:hypothetical protein